MSVAYNDLSLITYAADTFTPQSLTGDGTGTWIDVASAGTNLLNAMFAVGDVTVFTSLAMKMQAATDSSGTGAVDIDNGAFTTVVAANSIQIIGFQLPTAASPTALPYRFVAAVADITGTSARIHVTILACKKMPNPTLGNLATPPTIN